MATSETTLHNPYHEHERKYLLRAHDLPLVPDELQTGRRRHLEQYYLNHHDEPYELRLRKVQLDGVDAHLATVKKGSPPDRLEMETIVAPETYTYWLSARQTEVLQKTRQTLAFASGHWALDTYAHLNFSLLEAEGDVPLPKFGSDVTDDTRFTNYQLAQMNDAMTGHLPDTMARAQELSDIQPLRAKIEHLRIQTPRPLVIGVAGDTASGKSTLTRKLAKPYGEKAVIIAQDDYYYGVTRMREVFGSEYEVNFDEPISLNSTWLAQHIAELKEGKPIMRPTYSMETSDPTGEHKLINPNCTPIVFVEGIHALDPALEGCYDYTVFVSAPLATRVGRRLERDLAEGRSFKPEDNLKYLLEVAEPTYQPYAEAQKATADQIFHT